MGMNGQKGSSFNKKTKPHPFLRTILQRQSQNWLCLGFLKVDIKKPSRRDAVGSMELGKGIVRKKD
jgi:hypothetical protein